MSLVRNVARPMLAAIFVTGGMDALRRPGMRTATAAPMVDSLSQRTGLPNDPELIVRANGATMAFAGLMLASGRMPRTASGLLAASLVPTTYAGHAFWTQSDPDVRQSQKLQFQKNLAMLGGLLLAAVDTDGRPGLAWRAKQLPAATARAARREAKTLRREAKAVRQEARLATAKTKLAVH